MMLIAAVMFAAAVAVAPNADCLGCYDDSVKHFSASVHAPLDCTNCHADVQGYPHNPASKPVDCSGCHADAVAAWNRGTVVMAITGLVIWYAVAVATWIPRWWIDIATTIHFYEAILATLAILIWHFYHVIFDPDIYPMNWAWFDGRMSKEQFEKEHPLADREEER